MNAVLLLAAMLAQTDGGELKAEIIGPKSIAVGQVEFYDAALSVFRAGQTEVALGTAEDKKTVVIWSMANAPANYDISKKQKCGTVAFGSGKPGEFKLQLIVARSTGADTPPVVLLQEFTITVTGDGSQAPSDPPPPRPEDPQAPPAEPLPPSVLGLYPKVQAAVASLPAAARAKAEAMAAAYKAGAIAIAKDQWAPSPSVIVPEQNKLNIEAMGDQRSAWKKPFFDDVLTPALKELEQQGKLKTKTDFALVWSEISLGIHLGGLGVK